VTDEEKGAVPLLPVGGVRPLFPEEEAPPPPEPERVSYLGFCLGEDIYGLPLEQLREVARVAHLRRVPGAPAEVAGLVNLRGEILCALDARAILGLTALPPADAPFLIALRRAGDPLGLVVDSIADIYAVAADEIEPAPAAWNEERVACCTGAARIASGPSSILMGLLDVSRLVKA
jgi:purine-binding chemotaxis protein CheW